MTQVLILVVSVLSLIVGFICSRFWSGIEGLKRAFTVPFGTTAVCILAITILWSFAPDSGTGGKFGAIAMVFYGAISGVAGILGYGLGLFVRKGRIIGTNLRDDGDRS